MAPKRAPRKAARQLAGESDAGASESASKKSASNAGAAAPDGSGSRESKTPPSESEEVAADPAEAAERAALATRLFRALVKSPLYNNSMFGAAVSRFCTPGRRSVPSRGYFARMCAPLACASGAEARRRRPPGALILARAADLPGGEALLAREHQTAAFAAAWRCAIVRATILARSPLWWAEALELLQRAAVCFGLGAPDAPGATSPETRAWLSDSFSAFSENIYLARKHEMYEGALDPHALLSDASALWPLDSEDAARGMRAHIAARVARGGGGHDGVRSGTASLVGAALAMCALTTHWVPLREIADTLVFVAGVPVVEAPRVPLVDAAAPRPCAGFELSPRRARSGAAVSAPEMWAMCAVWSFMAKGGARAGGARARSPRPDAEGARAHIMARVLAFAPAEIVLALCSAEHGALCVDVAAEIAAAQLARLAPPARPPFAWWLGVQLAASLLVEGFACNAASAASRRNLRHCATEYAVGAPAAPVRESAAPFLASARTVERTGEISAVLERRGHWSLHTERQVAYVGEAALRSAIGTAAAILGRGETVFDHACAEHAPRGFWCASDAAANLAADFLGARCARYAEAHAPPAPEADGFEAAYAAALRRGAEVDALARARLAALAEPKP